MDKREQNKTITIKINGKQQSFAEIHQEDANLQQHSHNDRIMPEKIDSNDFIKEEGTEQETEKELTNIPGTIETAAAKDEGDNGFEWVLPETDAELEIADIDNEEIENPTVRPSAQKKRPKLFSGRKTGSSPLAKTGLYKTVFLAVFFAVLLGTSIGLSVLKLVIADPVLDEGDNETSVSGANVKQTSGTETTSNGAFTLPVIKSFVVQGGIFTNEASAYQIEAEIKTKGLAAVIFPENNQSVLLLSVADSMEQARALREKMLSVGLTEAFPKEKAFGGTQVSGLNKEETDYLTTLSAIMQTINSALSLATTTGAVSKPAVDSLNQELKKWSQQATASFKHPKVLELKKAVESLAKRLNRKSTQLTAEEIFQLQQDMLLVLRSYQSIS